MSTFMIQHQVNLAYAKVMLIRQYGGENYKGFTGSFYGKIEKKEL